MGRYENAEGFIKEMIAELLFPVALDKTFYYKIPENLKDKIVPGIRVYASFSKRKKVLGYVLNIIEQSSDIVNIVELKEIDKVVDEKPIYIVEKFLAVSKYISRKWFSPLGLVLADFLRYLPLKIELKNELNNEMGDKDTQILVKDPQNLSDDLEELIKHNTVIIFFPNIFSLNIFAASLKNISFKKYSSQEKISEKKQISKMLINKEINLLLTTKSGVFLPFPENTVFILIDPLNHMYRQFDQHPYYDTVDLVMKISEIFNYKLIFYSNFIPIEFTDKINSGLIKVEKKDFIFTKPKINDIKKQGILEDIIKQISEAVSDNKKVLVVSYSKYFSGISYCPKCSWIKRCIKCGRIMKSDEIDKKKIFYCNYCNNKEEYVNICPTCKVVLEDKGFGTKKIYDELFLDFTDKRIIEFDGRIIYNKQLFSKVIETLSKKDFDVIISTEIILTSVLKAKFDFIVLIMYESHNDYDYKYSEIFLDKFLILNANLNNNVQILIYTYNPENYIFSKLQSSSIDISDEIELRKKFHYPPYAYLYQIEFAHLDKKEFKLIINDFINLFNDDFKKDYDIIEFVPNLKIRKQRGVKYYIHRSWIKLKNYEKFFSYLKQFSEEKKLKLNIISY